MNRCISVADLVGQFSGDDVSCIGEYRADHFLAAADLVDQALGLAGPPHAAVDVTVAVHLFAAAGTAGQVGDVVERRIRLTGEGRDFFGDRVAGDASGVVELAEDDDGVAFGVVDDLLFDVVVDGRLGGRHESGAHVDGGCAEREGGDESCAGGDSAAGDDRDGQGPGGGRDQHESGDVVLAGVAGALETVDTDPFWVSTRTGYARPGRSVF
jgi:hypothetical protein